MIHSRTSKIIRSSKPWILVSLGIFALSSAKAQTTKNVESWLTTSISQRFDYGLEFVMETEQRFSNGNPVYQRYELTPQLIWHHSPRYDFSLGYEENRQWMEDGEDVGGHEGFATVTLKFPLKQWLVTSRQRFQGGIDDEDESNVIFRQQTRLSYELPRLPFRLRPFIQDEWFLDLIHGSGITENRVQLGLSYEINRSWRAELYGMRVDQWDMTGTHSFTLFSASILTLRSNTSDNPYENNNHLLLTATFCPAACLLLPEGGWQK